MVQVKYRHLGTAAGNALHAFCGDLAVRGGTVIEGWSKVHPSMREGAVDKGLRRSSYQFFFRFCLFWFGLVWVGLGWGGLGWVGLVRFGSVWFRSAWFCSVGFGLVWFGSVQIDLVRFGSVWFGVIWFGLVSVRSGPVWFGVIFFGCLPHGTSALTIYVAIVISYSKYQYYIPGTW